MIPVEKIHPNTIAIIAQVNVITYPLSVAGIQGPSDFRRAVSGPVVLAVISWQFGTGNPVHRPTALPGSRVRTRIVDRDFVSQRIQIGTCETFDQM